MFAFCSHCRGFCFLSQGECCQKSVVEQPFGLGAGDHFSAPSARDFQPHRFSALPICTATRPMRQYGLKSQALTMPASSAVSIRGLSKQYGKLKAVNNLHLDVAPGGNVSI